jgi:predicted ester cyclase
MAVTHLSLWESRQFAEHYRHLIGERRAGRANKAVVRRLVEEVLARGDLAAVEELFAPTAVVHDPATATTLRGVAAVRAHLAKSRATCPDAIYRIVDQVAEGDTVVTTLARDGAPRGRATPELGRCAALAGVRIDRLADGRIVESWASAEPATVAQTRPDMRRPHRPT